MSHSDFSFTMNQFYDLYFYDFDSVGSEKKTWIELFRIH